MKEYEGDTTLRRVFDSRQLGLKLIANVTYGYTSANFSGRMPCVELGDSVVSKGRETLERAIHLIEQRSEWKARVVYGDTDSVFVLLPGRSRKEAFKIGDEIALAVTEDNPQPVKLKFEKVYQPCILQVKKKFVKSLHQIVSNHFENSQTFLVCHFVD
jgi:DNA polymerase zeta